VFIVRCLYLTKAAALIYFYSIVQSRV